MSTRKLIIAAFVVGMLILMAGALQFVQIANDQHASSVRPAPSSSTTTAR